MRSLTKRQSQILGFIKKFREKKGYSPSYREIGKRFGISSNHAIHDHVLALRKKGYIKKNAKHQKRAIIPTGKMVNESNWSKDAPIISGYYWILIKDEDDPIIVRVDGRWNVYFYGDDDLVIGKAHELDCLWYSEMVEFPSVPNERMGEKNVIN